MVTEGRAIAFMPDLWNLDWVSRSRMFAPLRAAAEGLPRTGWPNVEVLNSVADKDDGRIVNANGQRIRFVEHAPISKRFEDGFEPRTYLRGEVMVRPLNWHDLFNVLVWMTFPTAKAAINARHYAALTAQTSPRRSATGDALTMFDEDGLVVLSSDEALLVLLREFRWKELFWTRRDAVAKRMRFLIQGHAMYEKALKPFVGMTAKSLLFRVPDKTLALQGRELNDEVDRLLSVHVWNPENLARGKLLAPLPVLGVPGWWAENEAGAFYDNSGYFRPGRAMICKRP